MKKCQHVFEDRIYLISCKSVEGLEIFSKSSEKRKIKRTIQKYLQEFCQILHLKIRRSELHMLVQMGNREDFMDFYKQKYEGKVKEPFFIPSCAHIFGRQMSNLLVSFVKSYNWKYKRKGVLMDGRYRRRLIESEGELKAMIVLLKSGDYCFKKEKTRKNGGKKIKKEIGESFESNGLRSEEENPGLHPNINQRGWFESPFKTSLIPPFLAQKMKIFRTNHPCGPNYN